MTGMLGSLGLAFWPWQDQQVFRAASTGSAASDRLAQTIHSPEVIDVMANKDLIAIRQE
jgi:hypothetical protein